MYVGDNAPRLARALFEIVLRRGWPRMTETLLAVCVSLERRLWDSAHPLRQFDALPQHLVGRMEERGLTVERLLDMSASVRSAWRRSNSLTSQALRARSLRRCAARLDAGHAF